MNALVYGLADPRTLLVVYVGKSSKGLARPRSHRRSSVNKSPGRRAWIEDLQAAGLDYEITVLEYVDDPKGPAEPRRSFWDTRRNVTRLNDAEIWWIAYGRACGWPLLNKTDGGEGASGRRQTSAMKQAQRDYQLRLGDRHPFRQPQYRAKISALMTASNPMRDSKVAQRNGLLRRGLPLPPQTRASMSVAATLRWATAEARAHMRGPDNPAKQLQTRHRMSVSAKQRIRPRQGCGTEAAYTYASKRARIGLSSCGPCRACKRAAADAKVLRRNNPVTPRRRRMRAPR